MLRQAQHDIIRKNVILRYEGSSSTTMAAVKGEEDASYLSMTKGQMSFFLSKYST
jgi:hypothetical protein